MPKIAIIGYCQTVALLNAIGVWRQSLHQNSISETTAVQAAFGLDDIHKAGQLFDIHPADEFRQLTGTKFCLLNSQTHPAARFIQSNENGAKTLWYSDALKRFLTSAADYDVILSMLNGSEFGVISRMNVPDFDFFPYDDSNATDRPPIDGLYITQWAEGSVSWVEASLTLMRYLLPHKKIIHVAPPPPLLNGTLEDRQRPALRLKIHRENIRRLRQVTAGLRVHLLEDRPEAVNRDGFLRPEFDDGHARGNLELGRLTARELLKLV